MIQKQILENNQLIAEFMELQKITDTNEYHVRLPNVNISFCGIEYLKFNSSWDWLMHVLEKICKLKIGDGVTSVNYAYPITFGRVHPETKKFMVRLNGFNLYYGDSLLETTFEAVVEFIKWYNQNLKS